MTLTQQIITIAIAVAGVQFTRWLPFLVFSPKRPVPEYIRYLGKVLPAAVFGMLVIYCYKDVDLSTANHGLPEFLAGAVVLILHFWKKNMFLSMLVGTGFYMYLVQAVFV